MFVEEIEDYFFVYVGVFDVVVVFLLDFYFGECSCVFVIVCGVLLIGLVLKVWVWGCGLVVFKVLD